MSIKTGICGFCGLPIEGNGYIYRWYSKHGAYMPTHPIHIKVNPNDTQGVLHA